MEKYTVRILLCGAVMKTTCSPNVLSDVCTDISYGWELKDPISILLFNVT